MGSNNIQARFNNDSVDYVQSRGKRKGETQTVKMTGVNKVKQSRTNRVSFNVKESSQQFDLAVGGGVYENMDTHERVNFNTQRTNETKPGVGNQQYR